MVLQELVKISCSTASAGLQNAAVAVASVLPSWRCASQLPQPALQLPSVVWPS
jgi:hypothetical protein